MKRSDKAGAGSRGAAAVAELAQPRKSPPLYLWCAALVLVALAAYANHFENGFHLDDGQTILQNPYIRSLRNTPRFFSDSHPIVTTSLAFDYWLSGGFQPPRRASKPALSR